MLPARALWPPLVKSSLVSQSSGETDCWVVAIWGAEIIENVFLEQGGFVRLSTADIGADNSLWWGPSC